VFCIASRNAAGKIGGQTFVGGATRARMNASSEADRRYRGTVWRSEGIGSASKGKVRDRIRADYGRARL